MTLPGNWATGQSFTAAAENAVETAVNLNTGKLINPMNYGAVGNGTTDDTAAINAAITACGNKGTVIFPAGHTFLYIGTITIPNGVALVGGGHGFQEEHLRAGAAAALINVTGSYSQLRDLSINGNNVGQIGIHVTFSDRNSFHSVLVHQFTQAGFIFDEAQNCTVEDCSAYNCATAATPSGWPGVAGWMFINGASTMTMLNCTSAQGAGGTNANYSAIIITNITTDARLEAGPQAGNENGLLRFFSGIHETYSSTTGVARVLATYGNSWGYSVIFHDVIFVGPSSTATITVGPSFPGPLVFADCQFHSLGEAGSSPFVNASSGRIVFTGTCYRLQGPLSAETVLTGSATSTVATVAGFT